MQLDVIEWVWRIEIGLVFAASRHGIRLKVHSLAEMFCLRTDNPDWRKAKFLRYASSHRGDFFCLADVVEGRLQATRPSLCLWRHSRSCTLTPWHSAAGEREWDVECMWEEGSYVAVWVWACGGRERTGRMGLLWKSSHALGRSEFPLYLTSTARASFAQPVLLISPICRHPETCCSLAASPQAFFFYMQS